MKNTPSSLIRSSEGAKYFMMFMFKKFVRFIVEIAFLKAK
jgi:hypothetical protein